MKQSAVEWLVDKILVQQEIYMDEEGEWIDIPQIEYVNGYKSHVDLSEFVEQAKEMEKQQKLKHNEMLKMLKIISNGFDDSKKYLIIKKVKELIKEITEI